MAPVLNLSVCGKVLTVTRNRAEFLGLISKLCVISALKDAETSSCCSAMMTWTREMSRGQTAVGPSKRNKT